MRTDEDGTVRQLGDSVEALLSRSDVEGAPAAAWSGLVELGLPGMILPEALGGAGLGIVAAANITASIGAHSIETPLVTGALVPSVVLGNVPESTLVHRLAAEIAGGKSAFPLAWQEQAGQLEAHLQATLISSDRLNGAKLFVPHSGTGYLVATRHDDLGSALAFVTSSDAGLNITPSQSADGVAVAALAFDNVAIGDDRVVVSGRRADAAVDRALLAGAILRAAQLSGLASRTLETTLAFLQQRQQFGRKLSDFQVLQHRAVDLYGQTRLARASWRTAARRFDAEPEALATLAAASAAKARCNDVANLVAKQAIQMHGAFGFTEDAGLGRVLNAARSWSASFGNSEAHRLRFHQTLAQDVAA